jgi:hypothetical protein
VLQSCCTSELTNHLKPGDCSVVDYSGLRPVRAHPSAIPEADGRPPDLRDVDPRPRADVPLRVFIAWRRGC